MKTVLTCVAGARTLLWLVLLPWIALLAAFVLAALKGSTSAVTEAAGAAIGCFGAIAGYVVVRSLDSIGERIEGVLRGWGSDEHGS